MAFKTKSSYEMPAQQFSWALDSALHIKQKAQEVRNSAVAGSVSTDILFNELRSTLMNSLGRLDTAQATSGMTEYAKEQFNDPLYDIGPEFTTMRAEIVTTIAWIEDNFPVSTNGYVEMYKFIGDDSGTVTVNIITGAGALSAIITRLDALIATID